MTGLFPGKNGDASRRFFQNCHQGVISAFYLTEAADKKVQWPMRHILTGLVFGCALAGLPPAGAAPEDDGLLAVCASPYSLASLIPASTAFERAFGPESPGTGAVNSLVLVKSGTDYDIIVRDEGAAPVSITGKGGQVIGMSAGDGLHHVIVMAGPLPEHFLFSLKPDGTGEMVWGADSNSADGQTEFHAECSTDKRLIADSLSPAFK